LKTGEVSILLLGSVLDANQELVENFLDSGDHLLTRFKHLLKAGEEYMWQVQIQMCKISGLDRGTHDWYASMEHALRRQLPRNPQMLLRLVQLLIVIWRLC
jgi:hypothetical protein